MGDFNGCIGNQNGGIEEIMGRRGETTKNNNRGGIIKLCTD